MTNEPKKRPAIHENLTPNFKYSCGVFHVNVGFDNEGNVSIINIRQGWPNGCIRTHVEKLSGMINLAIKYHCPLSEILEVLKSEFNKYDKDGNCTNSICCEKFNCHEEIAKCIESCLPVVEEKK